MLLKELHSIESEEIHFVTDQYFSTSIKGVDRISRQQETAEAYHISGSNQRLHNKWNEKLKNLNIRTAIVKFLVEAWRKEECGAIFKSKVLYINSGNDCYRFCMENGTWKRSVVEFLYSTHEEADSRMMFHLSRAPTPNQIVIRTTADTDVLIILLGCIEHLDETGSDYTSSFSHK